MIQQATDKYVSMTGRSPSNLVLPGIRKLKEFRDFYQGLVSRSRISDFNVVEEEFLEILRTPGGYRIRGVQLYQQDTGEVFKTYLEKDKVPEGSVGTALKRLGIGDSITIHIAGKDTLEMAKKREPYLPAEKIQTQSNSNQVEFYRINQTDQGYEAWVKPENKHGIHARPAALLVERMSKYESEISLENQDKRADTKDIMGLLTLEASKGTSLRASARGADSKQALEDLVDLFQAKFYED